MDRHSGRAVPRFPLDRARAYGEIKLLLHWSDPYDFGTDALIAKLRAGLASFTRDDYLLVCGNPSMIGLAVKIALDLSPVVKVLEWDQRERRYYIRSLPSFFASSAVAR
jgi:hypothetical protein